MDYFKEKIDLLKRVKTNRKITTTKTAKRRVEYVQCKHCYSMILKKELYGNNSVCPKCNYHYRLSAKERIDLVFDEGYQIIREENVSLNPLNFPSYKKKVEELQDNLELEEAVEVGKGTILGNPCYFFVMDSFFLMGSMGVIVGNKIANCFDSARKENLPVISFSASGGARMQEGIFSLMQMVNTTFSLRQHSEAGNLYVSVMTDPTSGGISASFASLGDIILAEPGALICFTGRRVIEQTLKSELPEEFQSAESMLKHGFLDDIISRSELRNYLGKVLKYHRRSNEAESIV